MNKSDRRALIVFFVLLTITVASLIYLIPR